MRAEALVVEGCAIATVDAAGTEHAAGHLVVDDGRIAAVGPGPAPGDLQDARRVDGSGCLATPGLVNCHHHLYQWLTRGLAQQATLLEWLTELYPVWARLDAELQAAAATAALAALLTSGCSTTTDHHYVFPAGAGDLLEPEVEAAARLGIRFQPCRGSMDLGRSRVGWLGSDVWLAHCVHLDPAAVRRFGETGTGVTHCPSSNARLVAGLAPVADLLAAGAPVGLGVDGAASNETGQLGPELRQALLAARLRGGPAALSARQALALGTVGGARCLGRAGELGSLEPGKLADVALWRLDGLGHADVADPVAALVLGPPAPVELLLETAEVIV